MPVLIFLFLALFGVGYLTQHCPTSEPQVVVTEPASIAPEHAPWARACETRLAEAARAFEASAGFGCTPGEVTVSTLASGVEYVEYSLQTADGAVYQVAITEEPDDTSSGPRWAGAPGCHGYNHGFQVVRHDHDRLGTVSATGPEGFRFAQHMESAANFCIEQAQ